MKRIVLVATIFTVSLFLIACNQTEVYEVPTIEEYDMTEIEDCVNTFRDTDENTVCDSAQREILMNDYQTHFMQYFDFSIESPETALDYSESNGSDTISVTLLFKNISSDYIDDDYVELFLDIYKAVVEDFSNLAINEEYYILTGFSGSNNIITHNFMTSTTYGSEQVRFGFRTDDNELTVFEDKVSSLEGYLNDDEFTTSSITVHGTVNEIRVDVDLVELTYMIRVIHVEAGEVATITIQEVDDIVSQYLTGYTLYEE